jgi:hypothetical protein
VSVTGKNSRWLQLSGEKKGGWRKLENSGKNCKSGGEKKMYVC